MKGERTALEDLHAQPGYLYEVRMMAAVRDMAMLRTTFCPVSVAFQPSQRETTTTIQSLIVREHSGRLHARKALCVVLTGWFQTDRNLRGEALNVKRIKGMRARRYIGKHAPEGSFPSKS